MTANATIHRAFIHYGKLVQAARFVFLHLVAVDNVDTE